MTPDEITSARNRLGNMWGLGRSLTAAELGRALRMGSREPGEMIRRYETGSTKVPGQTSAAIAMMLAGMLPPDGIAVIYAGNRKPR